MHIEEVEAGGRCESWLVNHRDLVPLAPAYLTEGREQSRVDTVSLEFCQQMRGKDDKYA